MNAGMHPESQAALHHASHAFVPQRLRIAREAAGLTQKALADRLEMTASAVSQLERGDTKPRAETVARIALTLGIPPGFFGGPVSQDLINEEACHFRSRRRTTREERRRVLARGNMLMLLAQYLETLVEFPDEVLSEFRNLVSSESDIESLVEQIREIWGLGLGPIADVITLVENKGTFVLQIKGHTTNLDAFSTWCEGRPVIFIATDKGSASRRRFDVAHELGHLLLHDAADAENQRKREIEADRFASAFLLPRSSFVKECPRRLSWPHFKALKKRWKVSLASLIRRAYELQLISEATYRRAFVQLNRYGWRKAEPVEPEMENGSLITRAIELLVARGRSFERIAQAVCLRAHFLEELLAAFYTQRPLSLSLSV